MKETKKTLTAIKSESALPSPFRHGDIPAGGGVGPALAQAGGPGGGVGDAGRGVGLGDGDLHGLAGVLPAVGTEALALHDGGAGSVEAVRDVAVRLTLHEGPLRRRTNRTISRGRLAWEDQSCCLAVGGLPVIVSFIIVISVIADTTAHGTTHKNNKPSPRQQSRR